jgi:hypothetical protein
MFQGMESSVSSILNSFVGAEIGGLDYETGFSAKPYHISSSEAVFTNVFPLLVLRYARFKIKLDK